MTNCQDFINIAGIFAGLFGGSVFIILFMWMKIVRDQEKQDEA